MSWQASTTLGVVYNLEEATQPDFSDAVSVHFGTERATTLKNRGPGTFYYRVKATAPGYQDSAWLVGNQCKVNKPTGWIYVPPSDTDGSYLVSWAVAASASPTYVLEESPSSVFSISNEIYRGPDTSFPIADKGTGTYYYRVKVIASEVATESDWRNGDNGCNVTN
jgi:hypothetical protein